MSSAFRIGDREVSPSARPLIIAEVGQAHDGSVGFAHAYIDAVADTGADAVKFQTHIAAAESTPEEPFRVPFSYEDRTRFDYWKRMEFREEQWAELKHHAEEVGLIFLSSAFSVEAFKLLDRLGVTAWKVASGEITNEPLLRCMAESKKPILLSSGMSDYGTIDRALEVCDGQTRAIFQCTSRYPTPFASVGLNLITDLRQRYAIPVGLSDHSGTIYPSIAAMAIGACLVEVHIVLSRASFGPDVQASVTLTELRQIVEARDAVYAMHSNPIDKDKEAATFEHMRTVFQKSVALASPKTAGTILTAEMLVAKRPGTGIPASELGRCVGKRLARGVSTDRVLRLDDIEDF